MGIRNRNVATDAAIASKKLDRFDRFILEKFKANPSSNKLGGAATSGTTGDRNILNLGTNIFEYHIKGTQTITVPVETAVGLDVGMDQTADDGVELNQGILASGRSAFVIGTDAFYGKLRFAIEDVSGSDDCAFGFRAAAANAAAIDDYTDEAVLNVISGDIKIETILNNAATTTTDTTNNWADTETHTLEVYVDRNGVVTYLIDGVAPLVTAAFTFDSSDTIVPFFYFLNDTDLAGKVELISWEVGLQ